MKNKFLFILIVLFYFISLKLSISAEKVKLESTKIEIFDKGNIIKSSGGVKVEYQDEIIISGENSIYNKVNNIIDIEKSVEVKDLTKKITINTDKLKYKIEDEILISPNFTEILIKNKYQIEGSDLTYDRKNLIFSSDKKATITNDSNNFNVSNFNFNIEEQFIKSEMLKFTDTDNNLITLESAYINLKSNEVFGKEIKMNLDKSIFGNNKNDPRFKGRSFISNKSETIIYKGIFTPCGKTGKCPPWSIKADEIIHKKNDKTVEYKNAWLEIYDKPVLYFPKFFHPDPSVKRQSGFLAPTIKNSSNLGQSFQIPYFKVISDSNDLTLTPRVFLDKNLLLATEYRQARKNSFFVSDFSFNKFIEGNSEAHIFANLAGEQKNFNYEVNVETVNNDTYLKSNKIKTELVDNPTLLNSFINVEKSTEDSYFTSSFEVFEDLTKNDHDRYEYILPNYGYTKNFDIGNKKNIPIEFSSEGFQKKYNTNVQETTIVNDLKYNSEQKILNNGIINNFEFLLRNVNTDSKHSSRYKENTHHEILSSFIFKSKYPLIKQNDNYKKILSPIFKAKYSPNKTKNIKDEDRTINYDNIFQMNRLGRNDLVEGGQSVTLGIDYQILEKNNNKTFIDLGIAQVYRDTGNKDLPSKTTLDNKSSDLFGYLNLNLTDNLNLKYNFSVDNSLGHTNYDLIKADLNLNKLKTSFEFLEEDNIYGDKSYLSNKTTLALNEKNFLKFEQRENLDKNITEFYNLIYEYKNNCLTASLEYNKDYYKDINIDPEENIFFKIKLVPLGEISSPNIK